LLRRRLASQLGEVATTNGVATHVIAMKGIVAIVFFCDHLLGCKEALLQWTNHVAMRYVPLQFLCRLSQWSRNPSLYAWAKMQLIIVVIKHKVHTTNYWSSHYAWSKSRR
jgi:hypothetical protein